MAPELPGQDSDVVRPIARRLIRFTCLAVLVAVAVAAGHVLLGTGPSFVLASAGAIVIAVVGARVARVTTEEFRASTAEHRRLTARLSSADKAVDAARRRALTAMADTIERESGLVMARLAHQAKAKAAGGDIDDLLHRARQGIIHVVRSANGDVERRRWPRMQLAGTVEIEIAGAHLSAPILDVSAGGVRISGALPADVGGACRMRLPGVGPELPATILAHSATETRLRFDIDEITRAVVNRMLEDATRDRAAAA